jgi:hypothetical protein
MRVTLDVYTLPQPMQNHFTFHVGRWSLPGTFRCTTKAYVSSDLLGSLGSTSTPGGFHPLQRRV